MLDEERKISVHSIAMLEVDGATTIPTVVYYDGEKPKIGLDALDSCEEPQFLNQDFKLDLGNKPLSKLREDRKRVNNSGYRRSPLGITNDFFRQGFKHLDDWSSVLSKNSPTHALIAEPVRLDAEGIASDSWLGNYRAAVKSITEQNFNRIGFLPEPFAVYQYYRYDYRSEAVTQTKKRIALVIDFGGGTFDVSVIETKKDGDISQSGSNQRPYGAKSIQVGGFYINRKLTEQLLLDNARDQKIKSRIRRILDRYKNRRNIDPDELEEIHPDHMVFLRNVQLLEYYVEDTKKDLCKKMPHWSLDKSLPKEISVSVKVPENPFKENSNWVEIPVFAEYLRGVFEKEIWKNRIISCITTCLSRSKSDLKGQPINVVLLSGGSANIRWLKPLIERDLSQETGGARIVELKEDYQEIVAKGLAIECARRFPCLTSAPVEQISGIA